MDNDYIKSLKIYVKECENLINQNNIAIDYYESMINIFTQQIRLSQSQNKITKKQIENCKDKINESYIVKESS